jgi:hypothetical protein
MGEDIPDAGIRAFASAPAKFFICHANAARAKTRHAQKATTRPRLAEQIEQVCREMARCRQCSLTLS